MLLLFGCVEPQDTESVLKTLKLGMKIDGPFLSGLINLSYSASNVFFIKLIINFNRKEKYQTHLKNLNIIGIKNLQNLERAYLNKLNYLKMKENYILLLRTD